MKCTYFKTTFLNMIPNVTKTILVKISLVPKYECFILHIHVDIHNAHSMYITIHVFYHSMLKLKQFLNSSHKGRVYFSAFNVTSTQNP